MQLRLDAADRLVELVEDRRGPVPADEAARKVLKLGSAVPTGLARSLLDEAVGADARLRWTGDLVALAAPAGDGLLLEQATYVVFDLETTGLRPATSRPCEIGAVRVRGLELGERFQTLANPGAPLQPAIAALTGLRDADLRRAPPVAAGIRRFLEFSGDAVLVAHNARFDMAFLDNETMRLTGNRVAATVVDTVGLARRLLGRQPANLGALAHRFVTEARPCHRALPDAEATAEILLRLIGMAQERGARTVADLVELGATRPRRSYGKRSLAFGAPQQPGVYLFRDSHDQVLYVGKARDLRARLRSYFRSDRQRPAVEAALGALARIEWRVVGSELEAALEELRLIRELRPPANARSARPDRYVYLRRRGDTVVCSAAPGALGPIKSRRRAQLAARALQGVDWETLDDAVP
jgi:DNA polymerase-3 subunit epsilon